MEIFSPKLTLFETYFHVEGSLKTIILTPLQIKGQSSSTFFIHTIFTSPLVLHSYHTRHSIILYLGWLLNHRLDKL